MSVMADSDTSCLGYITTAVAFALVMRRRKRVERDMGRRSTVRFKLRSMKISNSGILNHLGRTGTSREHSQTLPGLR